MEELEELEDLQASELERNIENRDEIINNKPKKKETSIESIPFEDDDDRHKTLQKPRRIRQDEGNYQEDENLFSGEIIDHRKEPVNTVKQKAQKSTKDTSNIKSKADALALDREISEKEINKPANTEFRRP